MYQNIDWAPHFRARVKWEKGWFSSPFHPIGWTIAILFGSYLIIGGGTFIATLTGVENFNYMPFWHDPFLFLLKFFS